MTPEPSGLSLLLKTQDKSSRGLSIADQRVGEQFKPQMQDKCHQCTCRAGLAKRADAPSNQTCAQSRIKLPELAQHQCGCPSLPTCPHLIGERFGRQGLAGDERISEHRGCKFHLTQVSLPPEAVDSFAFATTNTLVVALDQI